MSWVLKMVLESAGKALVRVGGWILRNCADGVDVGDWLGGFLALIPQALESLEGGALAAGGEEAVVG